MRTSAPWTTILLACVTFFEYGCTVSQRAELMKEGLDAAKGYFIDNAAKWKDAAVDAAKEYAEKKLKEKEAEQLKALDLQLATFKVVDIEGNDIVKTWKDFDSDRSGGLEEGELAKIAMFVTTQTAKKVASGEMSKDEAGRHAKSTGVTLAALMAILLGKRGFDKVAKKPPPVPPKPA